jgi:RimJ/RimL family protein N-acetyltransferase
MARGRFPPVIETERLILRVPSVAAVSVVNAAICESFTELHRWMKWADRRPTLEETTDHAQKAAQRFQSGEDFPVWGFLKNTGDFVLACGLHERDWEVPKFEIGYWCRTSYQGQGYVTEAVLALTKAGFEQLGANRIEIRCDSRNERSYRVAERSGYRLEAELKYEQRAPDGVLRTTLIYVLFPDEYRSSPVYFGKSETSRPTSHQTG